MKLLKVENDVAFMEQDGLCYMAAIDCFENGNYTIGSYIKTSGLPMLVVANSMQADHIRALFKQEGFIK